MRSLKFSSSRHTFCFQDFLVSSVFPTLGILRRPYATVRTAFTMPPALPIDLANFPALQTRKALLILDLQNEFLSPSGTLPVTAPNGYVERILKVAKAFRESGSGDVFWIRSQFDSHRPTENAQILTSASSNIASSTQSTTRGRRRESEPPADDPDADPEAFLSIGGSTPQDKQKQQQQRSQCLLPGSHGSELAPQVASVVNARQDLVIAKSHYSAFESTQLIMRLRTRFVTELYICGALTNISIHATALDAASHGLTLTIIEDCCGYRDATRHSNAISSLVQLTGCDTLSAEHVLEGLTSQSSDAKPAGSDFAAAIAAITAASNGPPRVRRSTKQAPSGPVAVGAGGWNSGGLPVRTKTQTPEPSKDDKQSDARARSAPSPHDNSALSRSSPTATENVSKPESEMSQPLQSVVVKEATMPSETASKATKTTITTKQSTTTAATTSTAPPVVSGSKAVVSAGAAATAATATVSPTSSAAAKPPSTRQTTPARIEPVLIDAGPISADEDDGNRDDSDDSFELVVPSRHEKLLEYARLRATQNASSLMKRLQEGTKEGTAAAYTASAGPSRVEQRKVRRSPATSSSRATDTSSSKSASATPKTMATSTSPKPTKAASPDSAATTREATTRDAATPAKASPPPTENSAKGKEEDSAKEAAKPTEKDTKSESKSDERPETESDSEDADAKLVPVDVTKEPSATEPICAGDTIIYHDVLPQSLEKGIYERLKDEVEWLRMSHQGGEVPRLVCVQGQVDEDGSIPIYRHPADESPPLEAFTPTVFQIKREVEKIVGHPLNHVLIQLYRTGNDYISEHSDKTLDIVPNSYVCNMSLGAERTMIFRTKRVEKDPSRKEEPSSSGDAGSNSQNASEKDDSKPATAPAPSPAPATAATSTPDTAKRQICRVQLPHNSLCRMGLQTNMKWLHAIRQDKRIEREKTPAELAYGGGRISLTFRQIGTFLNRDQTLVWGQGAVGKTRKEARPVVNGQSDEAIDMLRAFGTENHSSMFDWDKHYGKGFDVLHMSSSPRFFASVDPVVNMTVQLLLAELGINYARGSMAAAVEKKDATTTPTSSDTAETAATLSSLDVPVRLVDNDRDRSTVQGVLAILLYLDAVYAPSPKGRSAHHSLEAARKFTRLQQALLFQDKWRNTRTTVQGDEAAAFSLRPFKSELAAWDGYVSTKSESTTDAEAEFIAGGTTPSVADFALWPVLHSMELVAGGQQALETELKRVGVPGLAKYYTTFKARVCVEKVLKAGDK